MNIYLLERPSRLIGGVDYDEVRVFVIRAENREQARAFASQACGYEGPEMWSDPMSEVIVEQIGVAFGQGEQSTGIVCRDFKAG